MLYWNSILVRKMRHECEGTCLIDWRLLQLQIDFIQQRICYYIGLFGILFAFFHLFLIDFWDCFLYADRCGKFSISDTRLAEEECGIRRRKQHHKLEGFVLFNLFSTCAEYAIEACASILHLNFVIITLSQLQSTEVENVMLQKRLNELVINALPHLFFCSYG